MEPFGFRSSGILVHLLGIYDYFQAKLLGLDLSLGNLQLGKNA